MQQMASMGWMGSEWDGYDGWDGSYDGYGPGYDGPNMGMGGSMGSMGGGSMGGGACSGCPPMGPGSGTGNQSAPSRPPGKLGEAVCLNAAVFDEKTSTFNFRIH